MPPKTLMSLAEAACAEEELGAALLEVKRELRNYRKRSNHIKQMPAQVCAGARILLCRANGDDGTLAKFLQWKTGRPAAVLQAWKDDLLVWHSRCDPGVAKSLASGPYSAAEAKAAKVLDAFVQERALHSWVEKQNTDGGIPPTTGLMLQQLTARGVGDKDNKRNCDGRKYRSSLQYLRRWRGRWGVTRGSIQPLDLDAPEVLRLKVRMRAETARCSGTLQMSQAGSPVRKKVGPFSGPCFGPAR